MIEESQTFRCHRYCGAHAAPLFLESNNYEKYVDIPIVSIIKTSIIILDVNVRNEEFPAKDSLVQCDGSSLFMVKSIADIFGDFNIGYNSYMSHMSTDSKQLVSYTCFLNLKYNIEFALDAKRIHGHYNETLDKLIRERMNSIGNMESLDSIILKLKELEEALLQLE